MKLYKNASGKQIIKISKKEWLKIGEDAGWEGKIPFGRSTHRSKHNLWNPDNENLRNQEMLTKGKRERLEEERGVSGPKFYRYRIPKEYKTKVSERLLSRENQIVVLDDQDVSVFHNDNFKYSVTPLEGGSINEGVYLPANQDWLQPLTPEEQEKAQKLYDNFFEQ